MASVVSAMGQRLKRLILNEASTDGDAEKTSTLATSERWRNALCIACTSLKERIELSCCREFGIKRRILQAATRRHDDATPGTCEYVAAQTELVHLGAYFSAVATLHEDARGLAAVLALLRECVGVLLRAVRLRDAHVRGVDDACAVAYDAAVRASHDLATQTWRSVATSTLARLTADVARIDACYARLDAATTRDLMRRYRGRRAPDAVWSWDAFVLDALDSGAACWVNQRAVLERFDDDGGGDGNGTQRTLLRGLLADAVAALALADTVDVLVDEARAEATGTSNEADD